MDRDLERKAFQLCYLAGSMMMACKELARLQKKHANKGQVECDCSACRITLPDFSDEAIDKLTEEANAAFAMKCP